MIGIFGGTFDPIHLGHLRMALELYELLSLEDVRFIPCKQPVHKQRQVTDAAHRLAMLNLAIASQPGFIVDERELNRESPSYMIETLQDLKRELPDKELGLIIGSDALLLFKTWKDWQKIVSLAKLLVVPRTSFNNAAVPEDLHPHMEVYGLATLPISASQIRAEIQCGRSARYWVPDTVWTYINQHQLYR
jgi:nicotinate-nucleotide adenylyltransferase